MVYTRTPDGRPVERRRTRHALTFTGDPVRFMAAAARLVPDQRPWRLVIGAFDADGTLLLEYARDDRGQEINVQIMLQSADMPALFAYALRHHPRRTGCCSSRSTRHRGQSADRPGHLRGGPRADADRVDGPVAAIDGAPAREKGLVLGNLRRGA